MRKTRDVSPFCEWYEDQLLPCIDDLLRPAYSTDEEIFIAENLKLKAGDLIRISSGLKLMRYEIALVISRKRKAVRVVRAYGGRSAKAFKTGARVDVIGSVRHLDPEYGVFQLKKEQIT